jgi:hypothetical protein
VANKKESETVKIFDKTVSTSADMVPVNERIMMMRKAAQKEAMKGLIKARNAANAVPTGILVLALVERVY